MSEGPKLDGLPPDVEWRLLQSLDWRAAARLACVSRHLSAAVAGVQAVPVWRTKLIEEQTSTGEFEERVRCMLDQLRFAARPDLCIVFCSPHWTGSNFLDRHRLHQLLRVELPASCSIVVCPTNTFIGRAGSAPPEELNQPCCALSMSLLHLPPGAHLRIHTLDGGCDNLPDFTLACLERWEVQPQLLLVLTIREDRVKEDWASVERLAWVRVQQHVPTTSIAGGLLKGGRHMSASLAAAHVPPGGRFRCLSIADVDTLILSFHGPAVDACALTVHGLGPQPSCHCVKAVGPKPTGGSAITDVTPGRLVPLGTRPGCSFAPAPAQPGSSSERVRRFAAHHRLPAPGCGSRELMALKPDERGDAYGSGSADMRRGAAAARLALRPDRQVVSDVPLAPGTVVTAAFLEPPQGRRDCATALARAQQRLGAAPEGAQAATGCFMFPALSRGRGFYGAESVEARMADAAFPGMPIAGCFTPIQLGPVAIGEEQGSEGGTRLQLHTTVLAFLRLRGPLF